MPSNPSASTSSSTSVIRLFSRSLLHVRSRAVARVYSACASVPFAFASMAYAAVRAMPKKGYEPHFPVRDTDDRTYWSMGHSELFGEVAPGIINMTVTHDKDWFMDKHWSNKKGRTCWGPATCICCQARLKHSKRWACDQCSEAWCLSCVSMQLNGYVFAHGMG